jgi:gliding motility-associated-like protein
MKQIVASLVFSCLTMFAWGQFEVFDIDDYPDYTTCDAIMHDNNGGLVSYSPGVTNEIIICSDAAGQAVNLYFIGFSLSPGDSLYFYDGSADTDPFLGAFSGESLLFQTISSTNASGCLFVRFISNDDAEVGDFSARIFCGTPCDFPFAVMEGNELNAAPADTVKICPGESVEFDATGSDWTDGATPTYLWDFGDQTSATTTGAVNSISHTYPQPGGYRARLRIEDSNDCQSLNLPEIIVFVSTPYNFDLTSTSSIYCIGNEVLIGTQAYVDTTATIDDEIDNGSSETWIEEISVVFENGIYIPDNQGCLESQILFTDFEAGALVQSVDDFSSIYFNMEHSFVGDITITIICPNGQVMSIFPEAGGSGTFLGEPLDDPSDLPGVGYDYSFSPNSTGGTWMEFVAGGGGGGTIPAGDYEPEGSFDDLIGCPLNGTWTLEVCDIVGADDGYVFEFGIQFAPIYYPDALQFTPVVGNGCDSSYWVNPELFEVIGENCDWAIFDTTTAGIYTLVYEVVNDFGCYYSDDITITVVSEPDVTVSDVDVCIDSPELVAVIQNELTGAPYTFNWSPSAGLLGSNTASPDISPNLAAPTTYSVTVSYTGLDNCQSTTQANVTATPFQVETNDVRLCEGDIATLSAIISPLTPSVNYSYTWSPATGLSNASAASPTITGLEASGEYRVIVIRDGFALCTDTSTFDIVVPPSLVLTVPDTVYQCEAIFPLTLNCAAQVSETIIYDWNRITLENETVSIPDVYSINGTLELNGETNLRDGHYLLTLNDSVCGTSDSIHFYVAPRLVLNNDQLDPCIEELPFSIEIEPQNQSVSYSWDYYNLEEYATGLTDSLGFHFEDTYVTGLPGYYVVNIKQDFCKDSGQVVFDFRPEFCILIIPNIMTPNGDGENDKFNVTSISRYSGSTCQIFNRWGNLVFEDMSYDGTWDAADLPDGVYYYVIGVNRRTGMEYHSGHLTVLR